MVVAFLWSFSFPYSCSSRCIVRAEGEEKPDRATPQPKHGPRIVFENTNIDLGPIEPGQRTELVFRYTNSGDRDLRISNVATSCGCTALVGRSILTAMPGKKGCIILAFVKTQMGRHTVYATVKSNDPREPVVQLSATIFVRAHLWCEPSQIYFGEVVPGAIIRKQLVLRSAVAEGEPLPKIIHINSIPECVSVGKIHNLGRNPHLGLAVNTWRLPVVFRAPQEPGDVYGAITIDAVLDGGHRIRTKATVIAKVTSDIVVTPGTVYFGIIHGGQNAERVLRVERRDRGRFMVTKAYTSLRAVDIAVHASEDKKVFQVVVHLNTNMVHGRLLGDLILEMDSTRQRTIKVPVYGLVR